MRKPLIDYRLCNNKLPIETGRLANIDQNLRKCKLCNSGTVGDEFHYVMECCFFDFDMKIFLLNTNKKTATCITYSNSFNDTNTRRLRRLCNFLKIVIIPLGHILVKCLFKSSYTLFMHYTVLQLSYSKGHGYMH